MSKILTVLKSLHNGQFWYLFPHYYYRWKRSIDIEKTLPMTTAIYATPGVTEVHMLTGVKQHIDLLYAAKSFAHHYQKPISLVIHADTSVNERVIDRIKRHLPQAKIFTRQQRDQRVEPELERRGLKYSLRFRQVNVFGAKLIDAFLLSSQNKIILLDTDCLSFKPLSQLHKFDNINSLESVFAKDPHPYPYSISPKAIQNNFGLEVKPYLCTGFCILNLQSIDLNFIEKWLSTPGYPMNCHYAEQTMIAAMVSLGDVVMLPEHEYNTGRQVDEETSSFIHYCGHYLSDTRIAMRKTGQAIVLEQLRKFA